MIVWEDCDRGDYFGCIVALGRIGQWPVAQIEMREVGEGYKVKKYGAKFGAGNHWPDRLSSSRHAFEGYVVDYVKVGVAAIVADLIARGEWHLCSLCGCYQDAMDPNLCLRERQRCHRCHFWEREIARGGAVIIDGRQYRMGHEPGQREDRQGLGFGGDRFQIEFFDGRREVSHNLWHQGEVPAHFREQLPDNARFVNGAKWSRGSDGIWCMSNPEQPVAP